MIVPSLIISFIYLYKEDEENMDCSFFFGIGLELILECLISIIHLIECGGNEALSDFISDINCDQFYTTLVAKFDQKTRFLLVHNIRD